MMFAMLLAMAITFHNGTMLPPPQDCAYDEQCGTNMCKVWQHGRFVCEPKQYTMIVWDHACIESISLTEKAYMEAPADSDGQPDMSKARLFGTKVKLTKGCQFRYDIRNH